MKHIQAIIAPDRLSRVMQALHALDHFPGVTVTDAQGQGRGEGPGGKYVSRGASWTFTKRVRLEIFCTDPQCDQLVQVIRDAAHQGTLGNGIIIVSPVERVVRVISGQQQDEAL